MQIHYVNPYPPGSFLFGAYQLGIAQDQLKYELWRSMDELISKLARWQPASKRTWH